jgi:transposase-like protein
MFFVSLTEACQRLGIDAKTLHRWLQETQLSLQSHPHDARKKGVSEHHLQMLARLHHRHLTGCEEQAPAQLPTVPASLLALPEQLCAMQAELVTLQQQVAALTRLLTEPKPQPVSPLPATKPPNTTKQKAQPARSAQAVVAKTKTPANPTHIIPRVEYSEDGRYVVICPKKGVLPFEPDTEEWFAWVREQESFRFVGKGGYFTAHHWWRVPRGAWRAHRKIRNHNYNLRLAPNHELTIAVLEQAAEVLQAHLQ